MVRRLNITATDKVTADQAYALTHSGVVSGGRSRYQCVQGKYDVPARICADKLASYGAAICRRLVEVDHRVVISTARCNNLIEQRASVVSRAVLPKTIPPAYTPSGTTTTGIYAAETSARIPKFTRPHREFLPS